MEATRAMKSYLQRTLIALIVCALASITAFADKVKKQSITLTTDTVVNGTVLKPGDYELKFDEKTGELSILKDGKLKAKTTARLEARSEKARNTEIHTRTVGNVDQLTGITFSGTTQDIVVTSAGAVTGSDQ